MLGCPGNVINAEPHEPCFIFWGAENRVGMKGPAGHTCGEPCPVFLVLPVGSQPGAQGCLMQDPTGHVLLGFIDQQAHLLPSGNLSNSLLS